MNKAVRAVLDPNVIISAVLSRSGTPARVLGSWIAGEYELVCSIRLLDELSRALTYPKLATRIPPDEAAELTTLLRTGASVLLDPQIPPSVPSTDPNDDYLIALAESTRSVLVSGDRDLLVLADRIPVYSSHDFLALLQAETR